MRLLILLSLSLTACAPLTAQQKADLRDDGACFAVTAFGAVIGAALDIAFNTPENAAEWGAWGKDLGRRHAPDVLRCATKTVADLVLPPPAMAPPKVIGFQPPPSGPTAGPASPSSGAPVVGAVSVAPPHAVAFARWMRGR